jgi:hypothetical protein
LARKAQKEREREREREREACVGHEALTKHGLYCLQKYYAKRQRAEESQANIRQRETHRLTQTLKA